MIGVDLVRIDRIAGMMERFGEKALRRFLDESEIALVPHPRTAAGFWAAKEACAKALGCGIGTECGFHDIHITKSEKGAPLLSLSEPVRRRFGITDTSLSISHDGDYAIAVVALETAS
jgi:holo-[acyl-carrier protein] synthase